MFGTRLDISILATTWPMTIVSSRETSQVPDIVRICKCDKWYPFAFTETLHALRSTRAIAICLLVLLLSPARSVARLPADFASDTLELSSP